MFSYEALLRGKSPSGDERQRKDEERTHPLTRRGTHFMWLHKNPAEPSLDRLGKSRTR